MIAREKEPVHKLWTDTHKWKLIDYDDVWFNEDEGYWVNNVSVEFEDLIMTDDISNEEIFDYLKNTYGLRRLEDYEYDDVTFDGDDYFIELATEKDGWWFPLCRLERVV